MCNSDKEDVKQKIMFELETLQNMYPDFITRINHVKWAIDTNTIYYGSYNSCFYNWLVRPIDVNTLSYNSVHDKALELSNNVADILNESDSSRDVFLTYIEVYAYSYKDILLQCIEEILAK